MIFIVAGLVVILLFGLVVFFGAPYLPTMAAQQQAALDLLDLKSGQVFYDLGCGDGRLLRSAAQRGLVAVGYELNPLVALVAWLVTLRYRSRVRVVWGNFWQADIGDADGIFVFLLDKYMPRLDQKIKKTGNSGVKLASHAFKIPGKKPAAAKSGVFLYKY